MNKPKRFLYNAFEETHPLELKVCMYQDNSLAICADTYIEGYTEPWGTITVCISNSQKKDCAFVDTNNHRCIDDWLIQNNIATFTGRVQKSGFATYPEFKFNSDLLKELDPDGYAEYEKQFD